MLVHNKNRKSCQYKTGCYTRKSSFNMEMPLMLVKLKYMIMKLCFAPSFILLFSLGNTFAQTADTVVTDSSSSSNDFPVVNYSFKPTDKYYLDFDKILPFDQPFKIHFTDIPLTVTSILVKVVRWQPDRTDTHKQSQENTNTEQLKKWIRVENDNTTVVNIIETIPLLPNTDYSIEVVTSKERSLTSDEQLRLRKALLENTTINGAVDILAKSMLDTQLTPVAIITKNKAAIITLIKEGIVRINSQYKFKSPKDLQITAKVKLLNDQLRAVEAHLTDMKTVAHSTEITDINLLTDKIKNWTNYGTISDAEVASITTVLQEIDRADLKVNSGGDHGILNRHISHIRDTLPRVIQTRNALVNLFTDTVTIPNTFVAESPASTYSRDFAKNARLYVTLDLGYAYVSRIDRALAYSGVNIYFRPIDKTIPLSRYPNWKDKLAVRSSLLIGLSLGSVAEANVRKGLIGDKALVLGLGYRVVPFFKFNAGCFVHYRYDKNPVITTNRYYTSLSPFISFSVDFDAKALFSGVGTSILQ